MNDKKKNRIGLENYIGWFTLVITLNENASVAL